MGDLPYDAHTHTVFSDGRNTAEENVRAAEACGLRCVALTDHLNPESSHEQLHYWVTEAERLDAASAVRVLPGIEATILDTEGTVNVTPRDAALVKLVLADMSTRTREIGQDPPASMKRHADNILAALINAAANPVVDIMAHPFSLGRFPAVITPGQFASASLRRVARAFYDNNVAFEIMNQIYWWYPQMAVGEFTEEYVRLLRVFAEEHVKFVVGSDAHSAGAVGSLQYCRHLMREAGIELSQLVDLERMAQVRGQVQ